MYKRGIKKPNVMLNLKELKERMKLLQCLFSFVVLLLPSLDAVPPVPSHSVTKVQFQDGQLSGDFFVAQRSEF